MYNVKRKSRECSNQVIIFDTNTNSLINQKTLGMSVSARKNHCAAAYCKIKLSKYLYNMCR